MKFTVTFDDIERREIRNIVEGFGPFKDIFKPEGNNKAIKVLSSYDTEKETTTVIVDFDKDYMKDILSMFSQHLPTITASAFTIATSIRGLFMRTAEIEKKYSSNNNRKEEFAA